MDNLAPQFFETVYDCIMESDIDIKLSQLQQIQQTWSDGLFDMQPTADIKRISDAGRPEEPVLVSPRDLPRRRLGSLQGQISLMHSIAHIEFNAINLALDALYRFQTMPIAFYDDWLGVAGEESYHFQMIREHLSTQGSHYGALPAHDGLWMMTYETDHDALLRMALVPRTLEARGLDVTPMMVQKLRSVGDKRAVEILKILLQDEIGHVDVGSKWFRYLCKEKGVNPFDTFTHIVDNYFKGDLRGPFNFEAREQAGFCPQEIQWLRDIEDSAKKAIKPTKSNVTP